ncbi:MAG TPA: carbamoyltransferase HypF [Verrucomicrobiae bacterium]|nr:carbamoyltransferase HypF [Verrucomicrobiae bacterium]
MKTRVRAIVSGRVQGVGFRPTVYRYAMQFGLRGFVCNGPQGVTIEVEGEDLKIGAFFQQLTTIPPTQAVISEVQKEVCAEKGYQRFEVVESEPDGDMAVHIPPDLATCDDCLREVLDPRNRRNGYAFTNCTNCGPRFTIIRDLPYDRDKTSMAKFTMCERCDSEYHDPRDRRFHAQPNACEECGPRLQLRVADGLASEDDDLAKTKEIIRRGRIVAIKGVGGYHFACDATSNEAVARLRQRKGRVEKPFAVMFRRIEQVRKYCDVSEAEEAELLSPARPIVLLPRKLTGRRLAQSISPDTDTIGAFLPYTPLHHLLLQSFEALVMTSGNRTDEPIISNEVELEPLIGPLADAALTHNRSIVHKCDDSVLRVVNGQRQFLRRSRGYVPNPIRLAVESPQILAVGAELKNTFCLVRDGNAFLSQHIGDLKDYRTYSHFSCEIEAWEKLMRIQPAVIAHDLHPAYLSTRFAVVARIPHKVGVQHHHAHIASVMAEHGLHEPLIGVALDGTGYGTDGTIWGGEFMVADRSDFERVAHFKTYRLPGNDKAIEEPWRMAVSVLTEEGLNHEARRKFPTLKWHLVQKMVKAHFNSPLTSSAGRLFDAVASILGLCDMTTYEAQAAIRLESIADPRVTDRYPFEIQSRKRPWVLDFAATLRAILDERHKGVCASEISAKFHNTVALAILETCRYIRGQRDLSVVALSGGVFQNELLLRRTVGALRSRHFTVFTNTAVPANDGGLALGQAAVAAERMNQRCA